MVDWHSPDELAKEGEAFTNLMHALLGLYIWEFVTSLDFDWEYISRRRKFRWPMIFYFGGRYCLLFAMIGIAIGLNVKSRVNCEALYAFNQLAGDSAVGFASINLSLRTMAVWSQNKYVVVFLILIILGHWSLILQGVLLQATYTPRGCLITHTSTPILAATFIYSMVFDLIVMSLSTYKLAWAGVDGAGIVVSSVRGGVSKVTNAVTRSMRSRNRGKGVSRGEVMIGREEEKDVVLDTSPGRLGRLIFGDGLIYFFIAFLSNFIATVFMLLNLNSTMSVIFNVPAAVASTIVASRAVRRLATFATQGQVFTTSNPEASMIFHSGSSRAIRTSVFDHIQTETRTYIGEDPSRR